MIIKSATFVMSNTKVSQLPAPNLPEYAFIGRSNVGKSSLINRLTNQQGLAKTSQQPGKTQLINHFLINKNWYIVDLPGYGYAKVSKSSREKWEKFIRAYLNYRENLQCVFVLIDSRVEPQKIDLEFCCWLGERQIPFVLIFTKADKQSATKSNQNVSKFHHALKTWFDEVPDTFVTSSASGFGREEVLDFIDNINNNFIMPEAAQQPSAKS